MEHIWSVICSNSIIDSETNNLTLVNVIEQVTIETFDIKSDNKTLMIGLPFELVSFFYLKEAFVGSKNVIVKVVDPENKEIGKFQNVIQISKGAYKVRSRIRFSGIPFNKSGVYKFKVFTDENKKCLVELPLEINLQVKH